MDKKYKKIEINLQNALAIQTDKLESLDIDNLDDFNLVNSIAKFFYKKN